MDIPSNSYPLGNKKLVFNILSWFSIIIIPLFYDLIKVFHCISQTDIYTLIIHQNSQLCQEKNTSKTPIKHRLKKVLIFYQICDIMIIIRKIDYFPACKQTGHENNIHRRL